MQECVNDQKVEMRSEIDAASSLVDAGELSEAEVLLRKNVQRNGLSWEAFTLLAGICERRGSFDVSKRLLTRSAQLRQISSVTHVSQSVLRWRAFRSHTFEASRCIDLAGFSFPLVERNDYFGSPQLSGISKCGNAFLQVFQKTEATEKQLRFIGYLTERNCQSAPRLIQDGEFKMSQFPQFSDSLSDSIEDFDSEPSHYMVTEFSRADRGGFGIGELFLTLLEQQALGVYPGALSLERLRYNSLNGLAVLINYQNAEFLSDEEKSLSPLNYFHWCLQKERSPSGKAGLLAGMKRNDSRMWSGEKLNLAYSSLFREQRARSLDIPVIESFETERTVFRSDVILSKQKELLDLIEFQEFESVLEIGCGFAEIGRYLSKRGCRVTLIGSEERTLMGAQLAANLQSISLDILKLDLDFDSLEGEFYTVFLGREFVNFLYPSRVAAKLSALEPSRIFIETGLTEIGYKFAGRWYEKHLAWNFSDESDLKNHLLDLFSDYEVISNVGHTEHDRHLYLISGRRGS